MAARKRKDDDGSRFDSFYALRFIWDDPEYVRLHGEMDAANKALSRANDGFLVTKRDRERLESIRAREEFDRAYKAMQAYENDFIRKWDAANRDADRRVRVTKKKNPHTYGATHGGERGPWGKRSVRIPDPSSGKLTVMGRITKIEYETDKGEGVAIYHHTFGREYVGAKESRGRPKADRQPYLVFTEDGGLVVAGGRYVVKPEGIVG